ncbi:MAG: hypothetical protein E6R04_08795 [Spirochaetes bacterium]|nr:MAG: hypothetical protein E6R04_08795 [Spirochaetota bacterium]
MTTAKVGALLKARDGIKAILVYSFENNGVVNCKIHDRGVQILPGDFGIALQTPKMNSCALILHCKTGMIVNGRIAEPWDSCRLVHISLPCFEEVVVDDNDL